jgi:hypothetical protein
MPAKDEQPVFTHHQKVVAARDLPGIPAGTKGKVLLITGLSWIRYRVLFANGVEQGMLNAPDLTTPALWANLARAEADAEREVQRDAHRSEMLASIGMAPGPNGNAVPLEDPAAPSTPTA